MGVNLSSISMEGAARDLHAPQEVINLTVSCFVLGFGIG